MPKIQNQIKFYKYTTNVGVFALAVLSLLTLNILIPINFKSETAVATGDSTSTTSLTLDVASSTAGVELLVTSGSGTFASTASGDEMSFNVTTNNVTGYMLSISAKSGTDLTNNVAGTSFASLDATNSTIATGITADAFGNASNTVYNNMWGFKPNYYKSNANSDKFYPSPTTSGVTLNKTDSANTSGSSDIYTIAIGARATYAQVAGTYSNTYKLSAVGNYPKYSIKYNDESGDSTLNNMPMPNSVVAESAGSAYTTLSSSVPTRTGYTFAGWCTIENSYDVTICGGVVYDAGDEYPLSSLSTNTIKLYSTWSANKYDVAINTDGNVSGVAIIDSNGETVSSMLVDNHIYSLVYNQLYTITPSFADGYEVDSITLESGAGVLTMIGDGPSATYLVEAGVATISITSKSSGPCKPDGTTISTIGCMQDISSNNKSSVMASMITNEQYKLVDSRDGKEYYVSKMNTAGGIADYEIWMTQNLDLCIGCDADANGTGIATAALTSKNTDLNAYDSGIYTNATGYSYNDGVITWSPAETAITNGSVPDGAHTGYVGGASGFSNSNMYPYSAEGRDIYVITSGNSDADTITDTCADEAICPHYHRGNYYNWSVAVASNDTTNISNMYDNAENSICPAGWRLPYGANGSGIAKYREFGNLLRRNNAIGSVTSTAYVDNGFINIRTNPMYFVRGGHLYSSLFYYSAGIGYYWSSTVYDSNNAFWLAFSSNSANPSERNGRYYGVNVRCVARDYPETIETTICNPSGLTIDTIHCMQDINSTNKSSIMASMNVGAQYKLMDSRDGKEYYVSKMNTAGGIADYEIWMTQNLDLCIGCQGTTMLTSENTDLNVYNSGIYTSATGYSYSNGVITWTPASTAVTSNYTAANGASTGYVTGSGSWRNSNTEPYSGEGKDIYIITSNNTDADIITDVCLDEATCLHYHRGNYYNWSAAVASNNTANATTQYANAENSICPSGWELPRGIDSSGAAGYREFGNLFYRNGIIGGLTASSYGTNGFGQIRLSPLFMVRGGYIDSAHIYWASGSGYYQTSTVAGENKQYWISFSNSSVGTAASGGRFDGFSVRCVVR